jgi:hypothetical protein
MSRFVTLACPLLSLILSSSVHAQSPNFRKWAADVAAIQKDSKSRTYSTEVDRILKRDLTIDDFPRLAQLQLSLYTEDSRTHKRIADHIRRNPPTSNKQLVVFATQFFDVNAAAYADIASEFKNAQSRMAAAKRLAKDNANLLGRLYEAIYAEEQNEAVDRLQLLMEEIQNYQRECREHLKALDRRQALADNSTLFEKFVDSFSKNLGVEVALESDETPVSVAFSKDGATVTAGGRLKTNSSRLPVGAEVEVGKAFQNRRLYVESEGGTMLAYDVDDKRIKMSFPVAKYRLKYSGYNIVLRLRTE